MHGALREVRKTDDEFFNPAQRRNSATVNGVTLKAGDRVRIRPKRRADVMDIALEGKIAMIEAVEEDVDKNVHFAVVLEDDPGRDIGLMRHVGHRFFLRGRRGRTALKHESCPRCRDWEYLFWRRRVWVRSGRGIVEAIVAGWREHR